MKFRKKLLLSYIIISIIPILILGIYCYHQTKTLLLEQDDYAIQDSLNQAVASTNAQLDVFDNLSSYIAFNQGAVEVLNQDYTSYYTMYYNFTYVLDPLFNSVQCFHNDINQITIYSGNKIVKHGNVVVPISEISGKVWFQSVVKNPEPQWLYYDHQLFTARPIIDLAKNTKTNILFIAVNYNKIFEPFTNLTSKDYGIYITDANQQVIYSQNNFNKKDGVKALSLSEVEKLDSGKSSYSKSYKSIYDKIEKCNWNIYFYKPVNSTTFNANSILFAVLAVVGVCFIVLFFIIWAFSYIFVNRIELLTENMHQVEQGNLSVTVTSSSHDEVGELIESFGNMIDKINNLIEEVYESKLIQKESEMKALQAQINPHFLYNVLSLINWKAIAVNATDISQMTQLLATFYRTTLNKGKKIISVKDEIANTQSYVQIQSILHSNSFDIIYDLDEEIFDCFMINLILQPIVENAIDHGIDHKTDGRGKLTVSAKVVEKDICFTIEDNGIGIEQSELSTILESKSNGYGLKNVNDRIRLFYGTPYGVTMESGVNCGTIVKILIPKKYDKE